MKRAAIGILVLAACSKERVTTDKGKDGAPSADSASVQAKWDEMVPKPDDEWKLPTSWTEPRVIVGLARSCEYKPTQWVSEGATDMRPNRFVCRAGFHPRSPDAGIDLCRPYEAACEESCKGACTSCDQHCVDACKTCVQPCGNNDDCKKACATTCAQCNETCTTTWEACNIESCAQKHDECVALHRASWTKNDCAKRCEAYRTCAKTCADKDPNKCPDKCTATLAPGHAECVEKCALDRSPDICRADCDHAFPCAPAFCRHPP